VTRVQKLERMVASRNQQTGLKTRNARTSRRRFYLTRRQVFCIIALLFVFLLTGIGYVWSNFERTQIGYDLSELKKEEFGLREINRKLRLEIAIYKAPKYLEKIAIEKLGMKQPSPEQIVVLP